MSSDQIDEYLASLEEPKQATLRQLQSDIAEIIPEAEQCISYGYPAFRLQGKVIAGFAAFKNHLSYLPHSGSVLEEIGDETRQYSMSKGALRFPIDKPLPHSLVKKLIDVRLNQAFPTTK